MDEQSREQLIIKLIGLLKNQKSSNKKNNITISQFDSYNHVKDGEQEIVKQVKKK